MSAQRGKFTNIRTATGVVVLRSTKNTAIARVQLGESTGYVNIDLEEPDLSDIAFNLAEDLSGFDVAWPCNCTEKQCGQCRAFEGYKNRFTKLEQPEAPKQATGTVTKYVCVACAGTGIVHPYDHPAETCDDCMGTGLSESAREELEMLFHLRQAVAERDKDEAKKTKMVLEKLTTAQELLCVDDEDVVLESLTDALDLLKDAMQVLDPDVPAGADEPRYRDG